LTFSARSSALAFSTRTRHWSISCACASIGIMICSLPCAEARSSARNWVMNIFGSDSE
jgi:hypothetical protein